MHFVAAVVKVRYSVYRKQIMIFTNVIKWAMYYYDKNIFI